MSSRPCLLVCLSLTTATTTLDDIERAAGLHRASTATTTLDDIERAAGLHRAGSIDDVEYAELKRQLLSAGRHAAGRSIAGPFFGKGTPDGLIPAGREFELFSYTVQGDSGAVLTQFQYYGTGDPLEESGFNDTRIRYYVDGESVASVDYLLYLAHGMGAQGRPLHAAWGTRRWGSSIGDRPSVYNTIRVPFTTSIRITAQLPKRITRTQRFWLDLFGCEALPISIGGGILLPPREYRLRLHKNEATRLPMQEYISVVDTNSNGGIFYFLTISSRSPNATSSGSAYSFLEACWLWGNGSSTPQDAQLLTSGGEEMFFGTAYFYNKTFGVLPDAVVSEHVRITDQHESGFPLTAATVFDERPITFGPEGLRIFWQNGAWADARPGSPTHGVKCHGRDAASGTPYGGTPQLELSTYAFVYERL